MTIFIESLWLICAAAIIGFPLLFFFHDVTRPRTPLKHGLPARLLAGCILGAIFQHFFPFSTFADNNPATAAILAPLIISAALTLFMRFSDWFNSHIRNLIKDAQPRPTMLIYFIEFLVLTYSFTLTRYLITSG